MDSVLTSDIFFFITSLSVAIVTALIAILLYYIIKLVQEIRRIVENIRKGTDAISEDVSELRSRLREKGLFSALFMTALHAMAKRGENMKKK